MEWRLNHVGQMAQSVQDYSMIFQIIDTTVYIDYIVDCRQDYTWLLH